MENYVKIDDLGYTSKKAKYQRISDGLTAEVKISWFKETGELDAEGREILVAKSKTKEIRLMDGNTIWS